MEPRAQQRSSVVDYSFPWSMVEEEKAGGARVLAPERQEDDRLKPADAAENLPIAFRTWQLQYRDEVLQH